MDFYKFECNVFVNDECIYTDSSAIGLLEEEPKEENLYFSWDNIIEFFKKCGHAFPATINQNRRGLYLNFYSCGLTGKKIKQWKNPNLNIRVGITYEKFFPSIQQVLDWPDGIKAIAYLNEKGLKIK